MLIPGIKLGPKDWQQKLEDSQAGFAEIWYRVDRPSDYQTMLETLRDGGVKFGFHFWGAVGSGHEANLCYPGPLADASYLLIKDCILEAANQDATYVNIHSGNLKPMFIDFSSMSLNPDINSETITNTAAINNRNKALVKLGALAKSKNVSLLVEAIPQKIAKGSWNDPQARLNTADQFPASLDGLKELCASNTIGFTNDFCHTFAFDPNNFTKNTQSFAPYTRVIHVNTLTPPYNGTDEHRGILPEDFSQDGVFPSKQQFIELITYLGNQTQSDIWLIGEPQNNHVENYHELQKILATLG